jgi:hypothetical protein
MISGNSSEQLSTNLEMHFSKSHQLMKTTKPSGTCAPQCAPGPVGPSPKEYREVESFGPSDKTGSSYVGGEKEIDEVTRFQGETKGGEKEIDEVTRFNDEPMGGKKEIEEVTSFRKQNCKCGTGNEMVTCPMCNSEIHGEDEGDLSNNLAKHLSMAHQVEKKEMAPMQKM